jgi:RNA polymerase subunit RPABC4/transcription elongation factor Spt4
MTGTLKYPAEWINLKRICPSCNTFVPNYIRICPKCRNHVKTVHGKLIIAK